MTSVGHWAKRVDALLENVTERTLAQHGLARRHWQVLDALLPAPSTPARLHEMIRAPARDGCTLLEDALAELERRDWVEQALDGSYALTVSGASAHLKVARHLRAVRERASEGLSAQDQAAAVHVLREMAENLERVLTLTIAS